MFKRVIVAAERRASKDVARRRHADVCNSPPVADEPKRWCPSVLIPLLYMTASRLTFS